MDEGTGHTRSCSWPGCAAGATFPPRAEPAWCERHLPALYEAGELEMLERPAKTSTYHLTRCTRCQTEAHYRYQYVADCFRDSEQVCRACHWSRWGSQLVDPYLAVTMDEARAKVESVALDLVAAPFGVVGPNSPVVTRCRSCQRLRVQRISDVGWGCTCRRSARTDRRRGRKVSGRLLVDSGSAALKFWDHDANPAELLPTILERSTKRVHWCCPDLGHRFEETVVRMTGSPRCPEFREHQAARERARAGWTVASVPELAAMWDEVDIDPATVPVDHSASYRFRCERGHQLTRTPAQLVDRGCGRCRSIETRASSTLATVQPEMSLQWHPIKNGNRTPERTSPESRMLAWWLCQECGHEWQSAPRDRDVASRFRCPRCESVLDSLAWHEPELALEWSPNNRLSAWHVRPSSTSFGFTPEWVCAAGHRWEASIPLRREGSGCPDCRDVGKSGIELEHLAAAREVFGEDVRSGPTVRLDSPPASRSHWSVDILVEHDSQQVAIEYDGVYWHLGRSGVDHRKTHDLIEAGYLVARLREQGLEPLSMRDPRLFQLMVPVSNPNPRWAIEQVTRWLATVSDDAVRGA